MEFMMIWQRYSDKFSTRKRLCKAFKKRRYSAKLRKLAKQRKDLENRVNFARLFQSNFSIEKVDYFKKQIIYLKKEEDRIRKKMKNC
ncbi:MAG: hypothetical protein HFJ26_01970 [Clostridia bacterium]|nr:hypothetical protein [Clostridia bacterium]